ncbi:ComEC/Rec2 family competence protein [Flagellimonas baculiformis]|uniref:ComEC/Rec2 family competence protein n=1 Tax=Flagellimonas baculiformis TaxID=3067310 RepID=UPI00296EA7E6|nr:MBL fold metallo-hydrolase [Muricauda sp. D6]
MLEVTFKDVGQGDSIVLEWGPGDSIKHIGIIDCNRNNDNPVLKFIQDKKPESIEFLILSHPHYDHFSGMLELIDYCYSQNIKINYFLQTCSHFTSDFIRAALKTTVSEKAYLDLMRYVNDRYAANGTKVGLIQADLNFNIELCGKGIISFLSPTYGDVLKYIKKEKYNVHEEDVHNNPLANILSTICRIDTEEGYVLLTADTSKKQLERLKLDGELIMCQSPHHGSGYNHSSSFWSRVVRKKKTPVVFSVGANKYGHPAQKAVESFLKNDYDLYSTNEVGWLSKASKPSSKPNPLDVISKKVKATLKSKTSGDQKFSFNI